MLGALLRRLLARDRRGAQRRDATGLVAHYWNGAAPEEHEIRNISSKGLFLATEDRWYPGTLIEMTVQAANAGDADAGSCSVQSRVVRSGMDGVGCEFIFLDAAEKSRRTFELFLRAHL